MTITYGTDRFDQAIENCKVQLQRRAETGRHYVTPGDAHRMITDICIDAAVTPVIHFPGPLLALWATIKQRCGQENPSDFLVSELLRYVESALLQIARS